MCASETISIASASFASPFIQYNIKAPSVTESWSGSAVIAQQTETTCGAFTWQVVNQDEASPLDTSIFTFNSTAPSLSVQTSLGGSAKTYNLRVKVHRTNFASVTAQKDFTVVLVDSCNSASFVTVTPPTAPEKQVYSIGSPLKEVAFGAFISSPNYCPTSLGWSVTPQPADVNAIQVTTSTRKISMSSTSLESGMETVPTTSVPKSYTVTVYLVTENGTKLDSIGKAMSVLVDLSNPCVSATISLSTVVPTAIPNYKIGAPQ